MSEITVDINAAPQPSNLPAGGERLSAFLLVESGSATIEIDSRSYSLQAGYLLLIVPASVWHWTATDADFRVSYVAFCEEFAAEVTALFEPAFVVFQREFPVADVGADDADFIRHQIMGIRHVATLCGEHRGMMLRNMVQNFYLELYDRTKQQFASADKASSSQEQLFMRFLRLVHRHAATERDLDFYADRLCITRRYLSAIVRQQSGRTAKDFVDGQCVQEIKHLLRSTNAPLQEIAAQLRFPDQSFFTRYFKKNTGITPSEFRAR